MLAGYGWREGQKLSERLEQVARLRKIDTGGRTSGMPPQAPKPFHLRLMAYATERPWFMLVAVLPSLLAAVYYGLIASDIYVSEARFIVRSTSQPQNANFLGSFLQTVGIARSQDDAFSVQDYILSRDIVGRLAENEDLRAVLSRPEGDFLRRYPPPWGRNTFEQLYETYQAFVDVVYDNSTGISMLTVEAFRPEDAHTLAAAILRYSEDLINRMNDRARADSLDIARREVTLAEERVAKAQEAMTGYRLRTSILDPEVTAGAVLELVAQLSVELATTQTLLQETMQAAPASPQIEPLRNRIAALQTQINAERRKVIGNDDAMALQLSEYERLLLEREFATKALASATLSLETARVEAQRQQLYLEAVVAPNNPDYPLLPRRLRAIFVVTASAFMIFGIGWLVSASVREHTGR